ncbi:MAG: flagellar basal-body rod protein FlgG [Thermosediminibacterales bacterium]|nr:flagellar basal-body rod protein FlgG [Thermosediminibacterales bacterium]
MMRALWTAGSGMIAQQLNVDVISNNLSNVNTTGYKKSRAEFKDLLYETIKRPNLYEEGYGNPVGIQVGHGVRPSAITKLYSQGNLQQTGNPFDLAIEGEGFFMVEMPDGSRAYTRDGTFKLSVTDFDRTLVTSEGNYVLSADEDMIIIPEGLTEISIAEDGTITGLNEDGEIEEIGRIALVKFANPAGLENIGKNLLKVTSASGEPQLKEDLDQPGYGTILQGYVEMSNVQVVEEMVNLITAQRAYEINTKAIKTADEMLGEANNLRR